MDARYRSNFLLLAAAMQLLVLTLPVLAFAQDCTPSGIELTSQLEVDQFQANHGPCDHASSLTVTGPDITNLDGLAGLALISLLQIQYNPELTDIGGLSAVTDIARLVLRNNTLLTNVNGLSALTHVGDGDLWITENPALTNLDGLSSLTSLGRALLLSRNHALTNLDGLSALTSVTFLLSIENNDALTHVDGLSALTSVGGAVHIQHNDSLANLDGLTALTEVNSSLHIINNKALTHLDGLSNLVRAGNWIVSDNPSLGKDIWITDNSALTNLNGLSSLTRAGKLDIANNAALVNVDGLSGITEVSDRVIVGWNDSLKNIDGLSGITHVGDYVAIRNNDRLTNLEGLSGVTLIPGDLWIESNPSLADLDGLSPITEVGGALRINDNDLVTNLDVFAPLKEVQDLNVEGNLILSNCMGVLTLVDPIDDYEPGPGPGSAGIPDIADTYVVANNASGCDSVPEILAEVPISTINAGLNDTWFNPGTDGQGFFFIVFPKIKQMFMAWFTYDTERPPQDITAILGEPGHRWLTAQGGYEENVAVLDMYVTFGGVFDSPQPAPNTEQDGEIMVEFNTCNSGVVTYDIPSINRQGVVPIERIVLDNVSRCYLLGKQAEATATLKSN